MASLLERTLHPDRSGMQARNARRDEQLQLRLAAARQRKNAPPPSSAELKRTTTAPPAEDSAVFERLYLSGVHAHEKLQRKRAQAFFREQERELDGCTFTPRCSRAEVLSPQTKPEGVDSSGNAVHQRLYANGLAAQEKRERLVAEAERAELAESFAASAPPRPCSAPPTPRGGAQSPRNLSARLSKASDEYTLRQRALFEAEREHKQRLALRGGAKREHKPPARDRRRRPVARPLDLVDALAPRDVRAPRRWGLEDDDDASVGDGPNTPPAERSDREAGSPPHPTPPGCQRIAVEAYDPASPTVLAACFDQQSDSDPPEAPDEGDEPPAAVEQEDAQEEAAGLTLPEEDVESESAEQSEAGP
jgi:hypothetical protein